jgi:hypothetical protein
MILEHFTAMQARLEADATLTGKVFAAARVADNGTLIRDQYVILFGGGPEVLDDDRFTAPQRATSKAEFVYTVRAISVTADGALAVATKVLNQLVGFVPTITGRVCERIRLDEGSFGESKADASAMPPLYFLDADYVLVTRPT